MNRVTLVVLFLIGVTVALSPKLLVAQPIVTTTPQQEVQEIVELVRNDILSRAPGVQTILVVDPNTLVCVDDYALIEWYENAGGFYALHKDAEKWKIIGAFGGVVYAEELEKIGVPVATAQQLQEQLSKIIE